MLPIESTVRALRSAVALGVVLAGTSVPSFADPASQESPSRTQPSPASSRDADAGGAAARGADQTIRVHGHWTITVVEPDGRVVERREFDNLLFGSGAQKLSQLLAREQAVGYWTVLTSSTGGQEVCEQPSGTPISLCLLVEATDPTTANNRFPTLTLTVAPSTPFGLTLSGSLTAQRTGEISNVSTRLLGCTSATSPDDCATGLNPVANSNMTGTDITPVPVTQGQQVLVTVTISFS